MTLLRSPRTAVHLVTVLEEMPVQETADGIAELRERGLPVGGVVVNLVAPQRLAGAAATRRGRRAATARASAPTWQRGASTPTDDAVGRRCSSEARDHAERRTLEDAQRRHVDELAVPTYELPRLPDGVDLGGSTSWPPSSREQGMRMSVATGPASARWRRPSPHRRSTSTRCSTTRPPGSSSAAAPAASARPPLSAALALRAAERGRRVVVLTIDPARRLAQSMGIE